MRDQKKKVFFVAEALSLQRKLCFLKAILIHIFGRNLQ